MSIINRPRPRALMLLALGSQLAGCAVGPDFHSPAAPAGATFPATPATTVSSRTTAGAAQTLLQGRDIPGDWWKLFGSPEIEALVSRALAANPDLAAAQATLRQARENTRAGEGSFFPSVTASLSSSRQRQAIPGAGTRLYSLTTGSLDVSYTLDAFGGISREVEQLGAQAQYQRYQLEAAYLSLSSNLVAALLTEAALKAQVDTTEQLIKLYADALDITRRRFALGGVSQADVLQQQASLAAEVATLPGLQKQYAQQRNLVARYLGGLPGAYTAPTLDLAKLTLPTELPVSLPSQIVRQRPDILAYEALLHAATANLGIATANLYPHFTLSASYGRTGTDLSKLFTPAGLIWSVAGAIAQPIFEGGTLRARQRAAKAAMQAAAAQYSSTLNTAFQNVADALVAIEADARTLRAQAAAERTAAASLGVARSQFAAGAASTLTLLQAQQTYQTAKLQLVTAQAARFTDTVALYQALGGGWWNRKDVAGAPQ
ncbi:MAG TPA: efflux transporter outer membrane subunit [Acetobacteraceae bacterium]|jgi:NodT family efflux transporter outer membrane factor (OMF) lipoprotein|nr:efflux transporter outer membrane subunit [Acetobacteraceae bacterium]